MTSIAIQQLLQPVDQAQAEERALVFLNSKFPSLKELENKDSLDQAVHESRSNLEKLQAELSKSQISIEQRIREVVSTTREHLAQARELSLARHLLIDELATLSSELISAFSPESETKPTLLEDLEALHRNLKELESVKSYVTVIHRALKLSEDAVAEAQRTLLDPSDLPSSSAVVSRLSQYRTLHSFVLSTSSICDAVEGLSSSQEEKKPLALLTFLYKIRDETWSDIRSVLASKFLETLDKIGWPQPLDYLSLQTHDRVAFESQFLDLIKLQEAAGEIHASDSSWKNGGLYPIKALTVPITLRFKFHFETKRETNRIDKPEWYFTHMVNLIHTHRTFFENFVQRLLSKTQYKHINAFREFILHSLPPVTRKLRVATSQLLHRPSLLAHTIYQALAFDASLRDEGFSLASTTAAAAAEKASDSTGDWPGVSDEILGKKEWFEAWVEGERKFADDQYHEIISSIDAWQITDGRDEIDSVSNEIDLRPTNSARRIKALIEQITDRYQPLPRLAAQTRFLIVVQVPVLEAYHSRISSSLDAFETLSSSFVKAVPGALAGQVGHGTDTRNLTSGTSGVGRLIKAGISAHYMASEMERWGEDVFFLELWSEINARAALGARAAESHSMLPRLSTSKKPVDSGGVEVATKGTIFQELIAQYQKLAQRAEDMIVRHVCSEVESAAKPYFSSQWDHVAATDIGGAQTTLLVPVSLLSTHLAFLVDSLPASPAVGLYKRIAASLAELITEKRILHRGIGRLTIDEGKRFAEETLLWLEACRMSMSRVIRKVEGPWAQLLDTAKLLSLDEDKFRLAVDAIFKDNQTEGELQDELEMLSELKPADLRNIVRLREDCWR